MIGFRLGTLASGNMWSPFLLPLTGWWRDWSGTVPFLGSPSQGISGTGTLTHANPALTLPVMGLNGHNAVNFGSSLTGNQQFWTVGGVQGWALISPSGTFTITQTAPFTVPFWGTFTTGVQLSITTNAATLTHYTVGVNYNLYQNSVPQHFQITNSGTASSVGLVGPRLVQWYLNGIRINRNAWAGVPFASQAYTPWGDPNSWAGAALVMSGNGSVVQDVATSGSGIQLPDYDKLVDWVNRYYQMGI